MATPTLSQPLPVTAPTETRKQRLTRSYREESEPLSLLFGTYSLLMIVVGMTLHALHVIVSDAIGFGAAWIAAAQTGLTHCDSHGGLALQCMAAVTMAEVFLQILYSSCIARCVGTIRSAYGTITVAVVLDGSVAKHDNANANTSTCVKGSIVSVGGVHTFEPLCHSTVARSLNDDFEVDIANYGQKIGIMFNPETFLIAQIAFDGLVAKHNDTNPNMPICVNDETICADGVRIFTASDYLTAVATSHVAKIAFRRAEVCGEAQTVIADADMNRGGAQMFAVEVEVASYSDKTSEEAMTDADGARLSRRSSARCRCRYHAL